MDSQYNPVLSKETYINRVLSAIRKVSQLLIRENDPRQLIEKACRLLIETGCYSGAWIIVESKELGGIIHAQAGFDDVFEQVVEAYKKGVPPACWGESHKSATGVVVCDSEKFCGDCPLAKSCINPRPIVAVIRHAGIDYGALGVSVPKIISSEMTEPELVVELADDLAYALHNIEKQETLFRSGQKYRALIQAVETGVVVHATDTRISYSNPAAQRMLGLSEGQMEGKKNIDPTWNFLRPDGSIMPVSEYPISLVISSGSPLGQYVVGINIPGQPEPTWAVCNAYPNRSKTGEIQEVVVTFVDITDIHRAEEALRESESKWRSLVENSPDYILVLNKDLTVEYVNYGIPGLISPDKLIGSSILLFLDEQQRPDVRKILEQVIESKQPERYETYLQAPDGTKMYYETNAMPRQVGDQVEGIVLAARDVTERKKLEAKLVQSDRLSSMGMLAAGVAHEINNPLLYIVHNLESLLEVYPRLDGAQEKLQEALNGAWRIKDIVYGLGTFSRAEETQKEAVNPINVIEVACNMATNEIKYRARLVKDFDKIPFVLANEGRLSQVILNLLINAAHSIREGYVELNEIRVRTWTEDWQACIEVSDTGMGIEPARLNRLFEPFYTTKEKDRGSGLGLAISKEIVESYDGRIEVQSELGKGSRFTVYLPAVEEVPRVETIEERPMTLEPDVIGRILLVDDEPIVREVMSRMLEAHEVVQAASGEEAKKILEEDQAFDLILCDVMMPTVSGTDLHSWLEKHDAELAGKFVFVTGGAFTPLTGEYLSRVDNLKIEKPFRPFHIVKIVNDRIAASKRKGF
jgi:PAS domain S-box-containing protein